ncbi:MAG TPA: hypothetical protein VG405_12815 [Solirubrobacteraceae bacterium]|jgi:hypothetical protein|nr:hypothetical protein [Solirubrobacteraceae bacterium]
MSQATESVSTGGRVAFQVDQLEFRAGDRCEVRGRWSGVRGRRFMRPALTVVADGRRIRLLADLEHKPWAAEEGAPWMAEFPCEFDRSAIQEVELTVAPDITVELPIALATRSGAKRTRAKPAVAQAPARAPVTVAPPAGPAEPPDAEPTPDQTTRRRLTELQEERRRLSDEVEQLTGERAAAEARASELSARLDRLISEREELRATHAQALARSQEARVARDRMAAELENLRRERADALGTAEAARQSSDRFLNERAAALAAQGRAESEREAAVGARDQALAERDAALAVRHHALAERDAATAARDRALTEHDGLVRTNDRLQTELANQISARRGAALVIRRAAQQPPASRPFALLVPQALGLLLIVGIVLVVLALVKVI